MGLYTCTEKYSIEIRIISFEDFRAIKSLFHAIKSLFHAIKHLCLRRKYQIIFICNNKNKL